MTNKEIYQFGVKGMKWGIRRDRKSKNSTAASEAKQMSDAELSKAIRRMQMEKQYAELKSPKQQKTTSKGTNVVAKILRDATQEAVKGYMKGRLERALKERLG